MVPITQRIGTLGSGGQLVPGCIARVVKSDGSLATYEEEGELHVTGPQMALRYTNDEKAYVLLILEVNSEICSYDGTGRERHL